MNKNLKILVLEDHPLTRGLLNLALLRLGFSNLYLADDGEAALRILQAEDRLDIIICDIMMPGMDGLAFLRKASEIGRVDSVILSSDIAPDLRLAVQQLCKFAGFQMLGELIKPFTPEALMSLIDMYRPREGEINNVIVQEIPSAAAVQQALIDGELVPFFQPKIDIETRRIVGAEALVRWKHQEYGILGPGSFLQTAKHYGYLDEVTWCVARQSLDFFQRHCLFDRLTLSINLEVEQLGDDSLPEKIFDMLQETGVSPRCLILEITETGLMVAPVKSIENLVRLRLLGCGISIDDFGAGYSSLQRVCEMPCTELKLDACLIRDLTGNRRSRAVVASLQRLTSELGIKLVAEGIETHEQYEVLKLLSCEIGQGYWLGRPMSKVDFLKFVTADGMCSQEGLV